MVFLLAAMFLAVTFYILVSGYIFFGKYHMRDCDFFCFGLADCRVRGKERLKFWLGFNAFYLSILGMVGLLYIVFFHPDVVGL